MIFLRDVATNPMMISLLVLIGASGSALRLPLDRYELYTMSLEGMMRTRCALSPGSRWEKVLSLMRRVAHANMAANGRREFNSTQVAATLGSDYMSWEALASEAHGLPLIKVLSEGGFAPMPSAPKGSNAKIPAQYAFRHLSFQEALEVELLFEEIDQPSGWDGWSTDKAAAAFLNQRFVQNVCKIGGGRLGDHLAARRPSWDFSTGADLTDDGKQSLFPLLGRGNAHLTRLHLAECTESDARELARVLGQNDHLQTLRIDGVDLRVAALRGLPCGAQPPPSEMSFSNKLSKSLPAAIVLCASLRTNPGHLTHLDLSYNPDFASSHTFVTALMDAVRESPVETLNLEGCLLRDALLIVARELRLDHNNLRYLNLLGNELRHDVVLALRAAVVAQPKTLTLVGLHQILDESAGGSETTLTIDCSRRRLTVVELQLLIVEATCGVSWSHKPLVALNIASHTHLGIDAVRALVASPFDEPTLLGRHSVTDQPKQSRLPYELNLSGCAIGDEGVRLMHLSFATKGTEMRVVYVGQNNITDEGAQLLSAWCAFLVYLDVRCNQIMSGEVVEAIASAAQRSQTMLHLDLSYSSLMSRHWAAGHAVFARANRGDQMCRQKLLAPVIGGMRWPHAVMRQTYSDKSRSVTAYRPTDAQADAPPKRQGAGELLISQRAQLVRQSVTAGGPRRPRSPGRRGETRSGARPKGGGSDPARTTQIGGRLPPLQGVDGATVEYEDQPGRLKDLIGRMRERRGESG